VYGSASSPTVFTTRRVSRSTAASVCPSGLTAKSRRPSGRIARPPTNVPGFFSAIGIVLSTFSCVPGFQESSYTALADPADA
jgi:hypothetical protein